MSQNNVVVGELRYSRDMRLLRTVTLDDPDSGPMIGCGAGRCASAWPELWFFCY